MSSPDLAYTFVKDPLLVREAPSDMASLAALLGEAELADARSPLAMAIAHFEQHVRQQLQGHHTWSFFEDLMPSIRAWASQQPYASTPVPLLTRGQPGRVVLHRAHVRCLVANAFLLNIACPQRSDLPLPPLPDNSGHSEEDTFGKHTWRRVYLRSGCQLCCQKILCLLAYFYDAQQQQQQQQQQQGADEDGSDPGVVIVRLCADTRFDSGDNVSVKAAVKAAAAAQVHAGAGVAQQGQSQGQGAKDEERGSFQRWLRSTAPINASLVHVHAGTMESSDARGFVDFANRYVGYKAIIPSMTQEEVLWCVVPEVQPASLLCESMAADEAVVIRNVHRISRYSGYLHNFAWEGFWSPPMAEQAPQPAAAREGSAGTAGDTATNLTAAAGAEAAGATNSSGTTRVGNPSSNATSSPQARRRQHDVLVMDALAVGGVGQQFTPAALARDLTKAWLCFSACGNEGRSDGRDPHGSARGQQGGGDLGTIGLTGAFLNKGDDSTGGTAAQQQQQKQQQQQQQHESSHEPYAISSGNWGCGVFGGHRLLKFLQQVCALSEANAERPPGAARQLRLDFSTFGDAVLLERLQQLLGALTAGGGDAGSEDSSVGAADGAKGEVGAGASGGGASAPAAAGAVDGPLAEEGQQQCAGVAGGSTDSGGATAGKMAAGATAGTAAAGATVRTTVVVMAGATAGVTAGATVAAAEVTVGRLCTALEEFGRVVVRKNGARAEQDEEVLLRWLLAKLSGQAQGESRGTASSCVVS